ncbi:MAG: hypothetical protein ABIZ07_01085 [Dermatophilaceae bacterium]
MDGANRDAPGVGGGGPSPLPPASRDEAPAGPDLSAHAVDLRVRDRPGFTVRAHLCTWDVVVLRVEPVGGGPSVFVAKPQDGIRAFMADLDAGRRDVDLAAALNRTPRRELRRPPRTKQRLRIGVEHEYVLEGPSGRVDVRSIVDGLDLGVRADPTDPHAQRCPWGGVVTADGPEAEVATPPVDVAPGAVAQVVALAAAGREALAEALGDVHRLEGYSTHLNVSAPRRGDQRLALRFATIFAPSLMLLLDRPTSPGLLVRPRPGRLELGGEFADGPVLEVALTFAIGGTLAAASMSRRVARGLAIEVSLQAAVERYGWFVDRRAFGCDLYALGREAPLRTAGSGERRSAGSHLERTWDLARTALAGVVGESELAAVDEVVTGSVSLPRAQDGVAS